MLSRVRGERVMADMVQDNLCCSRSVVDWAKVTRSLLGAVSFPVIGLLVPYGMLKQGIHDIFPYFFIAIGIVNLLLFRVNAKGYVIDAENGMLEFPGGGIKVQNWTSHFNPLYLFQEFMRHKIALAEIREIHPPLNMRQTVYGNGRSRASVPSRIELNGDFGAVSLSFRSKEKRDELYLALVRIHHIGGSSPRDEPYPSPQKARRFPPIAEYTRLRVGSHYSCINHALSQAFSPVPLLSAGIQ